MATKTIGLTGRDYSTLAAWASYVNALALSAPEVAEVYNDSGAVADTSVVTIGGYTGSSGTNTVTLRPASGQGFKDNANAATNALRWNASNGAAFTSNVADNNGAYKFTGSNIIVDGLQFRCTAASNSSLIHTATGSNQTFKNLILDHATPGQPALYVDSNSPTLQNLAVIHRGASGSCAGIRFEASSGSATGCTFVRVASTGGTGMSQGYGGSFVVKDCAVIGFATDFSGTAAASSTNNATDKGTFGGTNYGGSGVTSITSADFTSLTSGSEDLRIGSGSKLKDAGATAGLSTDIIGQARGATYDIGAWEYTAIVSTVGGNATEADDTASGGATPGTASTVGGGATEGDDTASGGATIGNQATAGGSATEGDDTAAGGAGPYIGTIQTQPLGDWGLADQSAYANLLIPYVHLFRLSAPGQLWLTLANQTTDSNRRLTLQDAKLLKDQPFLVVPIKTDGTVAGTQSGAQAYLAT